MKKIILPILFIILFSWIITLYYVLLKTDIATQAIDRSTIESSQNQYEYKPQIALVTYAAGDPIFLSNQVALAESALNKGIQNIYMYGKQNIEPEFYAKNKHILEQKTGAGYWLWKPYFILKTMNQLPDNAIILYADSGVVFSAPPADKLLNLLSDNDIVVPGNGKPTKLRTQLKKEAQILMGIDKNEEILNYDASWNYFIAIRNNSETRAFIQEWLHYAQNADIITNKPFNPDLQEPGFDTHLHDQAIFGALLAKNPNRKTIIKRYEFRKKYGVDNFHRHPQHQYQSPKFHVAGLHKKIADLLYNNKLICFIREKL